ncbi:hypothetical protein CRE_08056 [Caenorhabditis remanei]|uniref:Reverse transcriptase domain-containing protein n=1 Tax=Caenorhabditis remanei TaxID=31234 RepID=E3M349_CAERE|nr:hypothetical protein CRE_08056 [Caenorhabditis remanei]
MKSPHTSVARSLITRRLKTVSSIPSLTFQGRVVCSDSEKASIFSSSFLSNFKTSPPASYVAPHLSSSRPSSSPLLDNDLFAPWVIEHALQKLPPRCGFSPHLANFFLIKKCATSISLPLSIIFGDSLRSSLVPLSWKKAVIIPVHKKGNPGCPENYRPISLTDPFSRIFERIICNRIKLDCLHKLSAHQHGFLAKRSCPSSLVQVVTNYKIILKTHGSLDVVFFDFKKAFDQVPLNLLLNKLALFDIPPLFISWFSDFLTSRSFSVKVNSTTDPSSALIHSGVPQGSVSGPLLFLLYINDLLISLQSIPYLHFAAYADDIKIYSHLPSSLQAGIDLVSDWAVSNDLPLAHSKTGLLRLGSLNPSHRFHIVGSPILDSHSVRDLGILFEPDLKFSAHIKKSVSLARLRSSQILKSFKSNNPAFYSFLFKTYVLPILEYASVIFCLAPSSSLSRLLESTLRIYSRKTLQRCNIAFSSYSHRLELLSIYSIRHRRLKSQLLLLYKFIAGASHFPNLNSFIRLSSSPRRPMTLIYLSPLSDNFFSFILPIWNAIVANVSSFLSPSQFEHLLDSAITRF